MLGKSQGMQSSESDRLWSVRDPGSWPVPGPGNRTESPSDCAMYSSIAQGVWKAAGDGNTRSGIRRRRLS